MINGNIMKSASDSAQRSESVKHISYSKPTASSYYSEYLPLVKRSYEEPQSWYYVTFKPFNDSYIPTKYLNCVGPIYDYLRKRSDLSIVTKEILATKIHGNALVVSSEDLILLDGKNITIRGLKYKLHIEELQSFEHRNNVLKYIFKEADQRDFIIYQDYVVYDNPARYNPTAKITLTLKV